MNSQKIESSPQTIMRLTEVRQRTGLSRSTVYKRIEKGEFPQQVSLGARAVGWLKREVEEWINRRIQLRPSSSIEVSEGNPEAEPSVSEPVYYSGLKTRQLREPTNCTISVNGGSPDAAHLRLVGTKLYFDTSSDAFWLKLIPENSGRRR